MSFDTFLKGLAFLILSGTLAWVIFRRHDEETGSESESSKRQRYLPYLNTSILPSLPLTLFCIAAIYYGVGESFRTLLPMCFGTFLNISVYYALLIPFLPVLRKRCSARVCALLWLLPNYTYLPYCNAVMAPGRPRIVLHIPGNTVTVLMWIWAIGFAFVLSRALIQHFCFRRRILKDAESVSDSEILSVWNAEIEHARIKKPKFKLLVSHQVTTPLSIGFYNRTIRVVLPRKTYTKEELHLILRHELIHICRCDSGNKFSMVFCCAMCWFNPLMWFAMRKSAEDLELSCDETVLLGTDEETRSQYANLILNTAADERGFTTCLSASPAGLRYRLKGILRHTPKSVGGLTSAVICFTLLLSSGTIALSYGESTGKETVFDRLDVQTLADCEIYGINSSLVEYQSFLECTDQEALLAYISDLKFSRLNGNYTLERYDKELLIFIESAQTSFYVHLKDQFLELGEFGKPENPFAKYHILTEIDWPYLTSLIEPSYIQDPNLAFPPYMIVVNENSTTYLHGMLKLRVKNGKVTDENVQFDLPSLIEVRNPAVNTIYTVFSHKPSFPFSVEIVNADGERIDTVTFEKPAPYYPLPVFADAQYRCHVTFEDETSTVQMEYPFEIRYFSE